MDEIIDKVGNFGRSQAFVFIAATLTTEAGVLGMMFMVYGNYNPGWRCANDTDPNANSGANATWFSSSPSMSNVTSVPRSNHDCDAWKQCKNVVFNTESTTVVTEWNLMCDNSWIPSMIFTIQMGGVILGSYLSGFIGDRYGRKVSLYSFVVLHCVSNLVGGFSNSWEMFAVLRFFIGIGVGGILSCAFLYPLEFVGQWWRPILGAVPQWSIGTIEFAIIVYLIKDWRYIHFATAVFSALVFVPAFWMPESMRWLVINGKADEFRNVVQRIALVNRKEPVDPQLINEKIEQLNETQYETAKPSYMDLFKTKRLRKYSIKFGMIWFIMSLVYYAISFGVRAFSGNFYMNMILFALTEFPAMFLIAPLSNKLGRRWTADIFFGLSSLSCIGIVIINFVPSSVAGGIISIALATFSKMVLVASWGVVALISVELYPTSVRNLHSGYLNAISRIGSILSPYMIPADNQNIYIAYAVIGALLLFSAILIWSVSESKGRTMTDCVKEPKGLKEDTSVALEIFPKSPYEHVMQPEEKLKEHS